MKVGFRHLADTLKFFSVILRRSWSYFLINKSFLFANCSKFCFFLFLALNIFTRGYRLICFSSWNKKSFLFTNRCSWANSFDRINWFGNFILSYSWALMWSIMWVTKSLVLTYNNSGTLFSYSFSRLLKIILANTRGYTFTFSFSHYH